MHRFAVITAVSAFLLLIAGGMVTSTDSGLAVPDWPLSYGTWFPPMVGGIVYEHGHRMIAGVVGLLILALAIGLRRREPRRWVRRLGYAALAGVVLQALLGGLTVLLLLPPPVSIAHACLGPLVFCLVVSVAWCTRPRQPAARSSAVDVRGHSLALALAAFAQLFLGAVVRHTGASIAAHLIGAVVLSALGVSLAWRARREPLLRGHAWRLLGLMAVQVGLGLVVLGHRAQPLLRTSHVAAGDLILAQAVIAAWAAWRLRADHSMLARRISDYLALTKPRLSALVLLTTGVGFWLGLDRAGSWSRLAPLLLGTACVAGGANALNMWWEREADARMARTRLRPLPAGRLTPVSALRFGVALVAGGSLWLAWSVNGLAGGLALLSAFSYLAVYTPLKRVTSLCTLAGAIPGALPPLIGWAGARESLTLEAWALFAILFVWQLPHFLALADLYREQYAQAGFRMLTVIESGRAVTVGQMLLYGLVLLPVSLFPAVLGVVGPVYGYGALALSLMFLWLTVRAAQRRSPSAMRAVFAGSILYLSLLLTLLAADKTSAVWAGEAAAPPQLGEVPAFALIDAQRQPVTQETLEGTVWVAGFIFTRCAGQCPLMSTRMASLQSEFGDLDNVRLISFTVDPSHDTPDVLEAYARRYGAAPARWRFVTGGQEALWSLAREGFKLGVGDDGTAQEPITHSVRLVLVDQQRRIRGYYDATDEAAMKRLVQDTRTLAWR